MVVTAWKGTRVLSDPNQAADELARWAENLERTAQKYQDLQGRMAALSVTESSADNRISVTVDANGVTTGITLAAGSRGMDPAAVAAELMACTRRAQARLRDQVTDLVHNVVGDDGAGQAIVGQYAERFPDPAPTAAPAPAEPVYTPPATYTPPSATPAQPPQGTRKPDRDQTVVPDEPDEDDLYYRRKSWLE
ncbi:YbaB/EbfC DNA-binding family protein [Nocardia amikacinitolerans]|uniref:YbaB/EbfC DNA-binding family protein n=1 Tax=Nocardia amikacinitolerans TaxID=756689 RepID=A0A285KTA8_9NOCA|nr:YbaB/EbfC DNA-binding family protein [Nocardia amikacinitolerans]MCP2294037.1 YbaB/EbfC DNA-binding family protein [Nocardia amikacinitolerans]SNY75859.1 YbaB/EbfC DNA-binding family protein [Nocardia amikacinitolerans]